MPQRLKRPPGGAATSGYMELVTRLYSNTARKLPPYARQLIDAISSGRPTAGSCAQGCHKSLWLIVGPDAWNLCREFIDGNRLATMLPPGDKPNAYRWDCLCGHAPALLVRAGEVSPDEIRALIEAVMQDGVERVLDMGTMDRYQREADHG